MDEERDEIPMLLDLSGEHGDFMADKRSSWKRSVSDFETPSQKNRNLGFTGPLRSERRIELVQMSGPLFISSTKESNDPGPDAKRHQERLKLADKYSPYDGMEKNGRMHDDIAEKNQHLLKSGQLGMCNDPYCTTCPSSYHYNAGQLNFRSSDIPVAKLLNELYGDANGWPRKFWLFLQSYIPGVMNPHNKYVQWWNKFFVISCLFAIYIDPLFFFVLSISQADKCIVFDNTIATVVVILRSITDVIYLLHILLQFRLAYVSRESMVVGAGELIQHPRKIARHYLTGFFLIDSFAVLPIPQIIIFGILPNWASSGANFAKNLIRTAILVQYLPRLYRFLPLLTGESPIGIVFESAWTNFIINLLTFILSGHVVGSSWYLFGLQRVNQCLRNACHNSEISSCLDFINSADSADSRNVDDWKNNKNATACFIVDGDNKGDFDYGIYLKAVNLVTPGNFLTKYVYSLFWGFQQISTLAGNLQPSYFVWEALFTMAIIGLGLLLFAMLIGNMQNFLQSLGRRRLEMSLRRRDLEQWMSHRRLPVELRRNVREADRYRWAATRGVNEEMLMENLPEDLQRNIRRHLFGFVKKVQIFALMDEPTLDSICEKLRQKTYIKGSIILYQGGFIDKMVFIVRGDLESIGEDNNKVPLSEGHVCGEELLMWFLEHSSEYRDGRRSRATLLSNRTVTCLTNVEAFALKASDIGEVTSLFSRFLRNPRVKGAIRYKSPYWRCFAATCIQVAWRYRKRRLTRKQTQSRV